MTTVHDLTEQLEQIDLQILKLLQDRVKACQNAQQGDEGAEENDLDTLSLWIEEAEDAGMDEGLVEKMGKIAISLCKKTEEE